MSSVQSKPGEQIAPAGNVHLAKCVPLKGNNAGSTPSGPLRHCQNHDIMAVVAGCGVARDEAGEAGIAPLSYSSTHS
jgi:hypothetical protein